MLGDNQVSASTTSKRQIGYPGVAGLLVVWTVVGSLAYGRHYLQDYTSAAPPARLLFEYLIWLTCFYPWIAFAPLVFRLERRHPLGTIVWSRNLGWLTLTAMPFAYAGTMVTQVLCLSLQALFRESLPVLSSWWRPPLRELAVHFALYWTTVGGAYVIRNLIELRVREQQAAKLALEKSQLETTLRQAELETLRARLNPHFLFNCLQNISGLTREDPEAATRMLSRLGALLRNALRCDGTPETVLASEIELTKAYVEVEKIRFADRLAVLFDIPLETEDALVPALLLQPLVENAILHGLQGIDRQGLVSVRSAVEGGDLAITVTDNGTGLLVSNSSEMELGVGLAATCERLQKMYPQQHTFSIASLPEGGTQVRIALPLRRAVPPAGVIDEHSTPVAS
jgi:two-component system LytT family sensor kinase